MRVAPQSIGNHRNQVPVRPAHLLKHLNQPFSKVFLTIDLVLEMTFDVSVGL